jgi:hypothetical protein
MLQADTALEDLVEAFDAEEEKPVAAAGLLDVVVGLVSGVFLELL